MIEKRYYNLVIALSCLALSCERREGTARVPPPLAVKEAPQAAPHAMSAKPPPELEANPQERVALPHQMRRGVALGLFSSASELEVQRAHYRELLDEIVAIGATDLSIVVRWSQPDIFAVTLAPAPKISTSDELIEWVISEAKRRKLEIFLLPIIHIESRERGQWRGKLDPKDPDAWWEAYTRYILHYAAISQRLGVKTLAVGSELLSMERQRHRWLALITQVRARYKGELTYSANWDHFEVVSFWDALDVVGMTAYQELSHEAKPSLAQLKQGWAPFRQRLALWASEHELRYMFTELGYPSHAQGCARPWDYTAEAAAAPQLQAQCFHAFFEVWREDNWLEGVYIWNWFGPRQLDDRGYSPRGKPTEALLRQWFKRPEGISQAPLDLHMNNAPSFAHER